MMGIREFREKVHQLREPVLVVRTRGQVEVIGAYYPEPAKREVSRG